MPKGQMHNESTTNSWARAKHTTMGPAQKKHIEIERGPVRNKLHGPNHRINTTVGGSGQRVSPNTGPEVLHELGNNRNGRHRPALLPAHTPARPQKI